MATPKYTLDDLERIAFAHRGTIFVHGSVYRLSVPIAGTWCTFEAPLAVTA